MPAGVYKIKHRASGLVYIGSSQDVGKRLSEHRRALKGNRHTVARLQELANRDGMEAFSFSVIEELPYDGEALSTRERYWIDHYQSTDPEYGFNILSVRPSKNRKAKNVVPVTVRVPQGVYDQLIEHATANRRSLNNTAIYLIEQMMGEDEAGS